MLKTDAAVDRRSTPTSSCRSEGADDAARRLRPGHGAPEPGRRAGARPIVELARRHQDLSPRHGAAVARDAARSTAIDLAVNEGEFVAIVGPSGCGKSTLLRLVAGLHLATAGEIRVAGRIVDAPQTELGIVFQSPVLLDWRTALDNVLRADRAARPRSARVPRPRAAGCSSRSGSRDFADRYPHELSGGMRQRVAIARALIHDAPLLLMDEPFGALDALTREQMRIDLEALWLATRKTVALHHPLDRRGGAARRPGRGDVAAPGPRRADHGHRGCRGRAGSRRGARASSPTTTERITEIFLARGVLHDAARREPASPPEGIAMATFTLAGIVSRARPADAPGLLDRLVVAAHVHRLDRRSSSRRRSR